MDIDRFEQIMLNTLIPALIALMAYIVWDLARKHQAGRFGTWVLFGILGLGVLGFIIKTIIAAHMGIHTEP